jgi:hypothetical protein
MNIIHGEILILVMNRTSSARAEAGTMSTSSIRSKGGRGAGSGGGFTKKIHFNIVVGRTKIEMIFEISCWWKWDTSVIPLDRSYGRMLD